MEWIKTTDKLPEKTGNSSYETVQCIVIRRGQIEMLIYNCEHECWDDASGDDYLCAPLEVEAYIPASQLPEYSPTTP